MDISSNYPLSDYSLVFRRQRRSAGSWREFYFALQCVALIVVVLGLHI